MHDRTTSQIDVIESMLATGHRSIRLERHTLILWGLTTAFLILFVKNVFTPDLIPEIWQRSLTMNLFIAVVVFGIGYWDLRLTRRKRELRDETISFVQKQLTKVWWLIIGLIILINLGMDLFVGKYLFYPILIAFAGLGFFIQGLFSQQFLAWNGIVLILLSLAIIILQIPYLTIEWLTIITAALGMPVMAWLMDLQDVQKKLSYRVIASVLWVTVITIPTWYIHQERYHDPDSGIQHIAFQEYSEHKMKNTSIVVNIPAGTHIPLEVTIQGDTLETFTTTAVPLVLKRSIDLTAKNGKFDGRYRINNGNWLLPDQKFRLRKEKLETVLTDDNELKIELDLTLKAIEH